jgi:hypothetical protein
MKRILALLMISVGIIPACSEKDDLPHSESIKIVSLNATKNPIIAYDTTTLSVVAQGQNLQYGWVANHGKVFGSGSKVLYNACQSCAGLNTITCRVFNDTGEIKDTIMIRVIPLK